MTDDVARSRIDVLFSDADMSRIQQSLTNHIVATRATECSAVGTKLTEWQRDERRKTQNSLTDDVVVAVVVVERALVVGRRLPRLVRYWLKENVVPETLKTPQSHTHTITHTLLLIVTAPY